MDAFAEAFTHTVGLEGGYSNDPLDPGGETMFGVTVEVARASGYVGPMRDLPLPLAQHIYRQQYWDVLRLDDVASSSTAVALELFEAGVNLGVVCSAQFLQRSLAVLSSPGLKVDGHLGAVTVAAARAYLAARKQEGEVVLLRCLNGLQLAHYVSQVEVYPAKQRFFYGWVRARVVI